MLILPSRRYLFLTLAVTISGWPPTPGVENAPGSNRRETLRVLLESREQSVVRVMNVSEFTARSIRAWQYLVGIVCAPLIVILVLLPGIALSDHGVIGSLRAGIMVFGLVLIVGVGCVAVVATSFLAAYRLRYRHQ